MMIYLAFILLNALIICGLFVADILGAIKYMVDTNKPKLKTKSFDIVLTMDLQENKLTNIDWSRSSGAIFVSVSFIGLGFISTAILAVVYAFFLLKRVIEYIIRQYVKEKLGEKK
jgi:hypothetical protein